MPSASNLAPYTIHLETELETAWNRRLKLGRFKHSPGMAQEAFHSFFSPYVPFISLENGQNKLYQTENGPLAEYGGIPKENVADWLVQEIPRFCNWKTLVEMARGIQMQTSAVCKMVCTVRAFADWFALRDSMRTANLNHSCNEDGCERLCRDTMMTK